MAEYRNGSPSSRFALSRDALLVATWGRIPKDWAKGRDANLVRLADAIQRVGEERKADRDAAADWLIGRVAAYCGSAEGQGKYRRTLARWLDEAAWAEDDAAWIEREPPEKPRQKVASW